MLLKNEGLRNKLDCFISIPLRVRMILPSTFLPLFHPLHFPSLRRFLLGSPASPDLLPFRPILFFFRSLAGEVCLPCASCWHGPPFNIYQCYSYCYWCPLLYYTDLRWPPSLSPWTPTHDKRVWPLTGGARGRCVLLRLLRASTSGSDTGLSQVDGRGYAHQTIESEGGTWILAQ